MGAVSQAWDPNSARDPAELRHALGVPVMPKSLERALTHRSYAYENANPPTNERLEFLGDSVLGLVVTDALFRGYPTLPEGQLAKLRAYYKAKGAQPEVVANAIVDGVARGQAIVLIGPLARPMYHLKRVSRGLVQRLTIADARKNGYL